MPDVERLKLGESPVERTTFDEATPSEIVPDQIPKRDV